MINQEVAKQINYIEASDELANDSIFNHPYTRMCGERKLLWALFERALSDLTDKDTFIKKSSEDWFNEPSSEDPDITSFQYISYLFGFNEELLREKVYEYAKRKKG